MTRTLKTLAGLAAVAALGLSAGCASTKQLDEVRAMAMQAQQDAAAAKAAADSASAEASAARQAAEQAAANSAMTNDKIDQMFKKAMMK